MEADLPDLIDRAAQAVADALRPRIHELERENDRLVGELRALARRYAALEATTAALRAENERQGVRVAELAAEVQRPSEPALSVEDQSAAA
jgi:chromosome segregation ATPase